MVNFQPLIAPLFVPANRTDRIVKAAASGADAIIVDLEDSVPPNDKASARIGLQQAISDVSVPVFLRINARNTEWFEDDVHFALAAELSGVMLPKTEDIWDLKFLSDHCGSHFPIVALVETAIGIANLSEIAKADNLAQIAFGSIDYAFDLNCGESRDALALARFEIVLRSRVADLPAPIDGVLGDISDSAQLAKDCTYALEMGFGGKLAIHPKQVHVIQQEFSPTQNEIEWATRVLAADADAGGVALQMDGRMIDLPVVKKARRILKTHG